jgi:hypothetical protein
MLTLQLFKKEKVPKNPEVHFNLHPDPKLIPKFLLKPDPDHCQKVNTAGTEFTKLDYKKYYNHTPRLNARLTGKYPSQSQ